MKILISVKEAQETCDFIDLAIILHKTVRELNEMPDDEILVLSLENAETLHLVSTYDPLE